MQLVSGSERIIAHANCDPVQGTVRWSPVKSLWIGSMTAAAILLGPLYFSWSALLLFSLVRPSPYAPGTPSGCTGG